MTATTTPKTPRILRYSPEGRTLLIADARERAVYGVDPIRCDFSGTVACRFTKLATKASYDVTCGPEGAKSCECRGWLRWNKCKHTAALAKLVERNLIAA